MAGHSAASSPTRYAGIQVQTSALGVQVPIVWGTGRCKCNLVWYSDFTSTAQKAASGKGGATVTGYSYSASIILGLCEGPINQITQVWIDAKTYAYGSIGSGVTNTGSTSALAQVGLSMATGAVGQSVWSYLTSKHPTQAIGYSGLCIVYASNYALDDGAGTPQHSFEVVSNFTVSGLPDANPRDALTDFFTNARYGLPNWAPGLLDAASWSTYATYCLAQNLLVSPVLDQERQASDFLTEMLTATNSDFLWSEGLLKIVVYGDTPVTGNGATFAPDLTPVYALTDDNFIPKSDGDDALMVDIEDQSDAYNIVQFEYLDRTNQYSTAIATANDAANISQYGRRKQDPTTVHVICDPTVAQTAAQLYLQRTLYIRKQYKFTLGWEFALLEPGDIVTLTHPAMGLAAYAVRIIQIDEDEHGLLDVTAEDLLAGVSHAPLYAIQTAQGAAPNQAIDPGGVEANLLTYSQDWTNAAWANLNIAVTAAATANPITGATDAQKLLPTTTNGGHYLYESVAAFSGASYTFSAYLKADGYINALVGLSDIGSNGAIAVANLSAGTVSASSFGSGVLIGSSITPVGSGWCRVSVTAQIPVTTIGTFIQVYSNSGASSFAGDGTSAIYAWGAQLTQGIDARPYAVTTSAPWTPQVFNPPSVLTQGVPATWAAISGGAFWGGCNVWISLDGGDNYALVGSTDQGPARYGALTASYALGSNPDTADTLSLDLSASNGTLDSAADAVADQSGTLCLVDQELISFSTATLTGPNRYNLTSYTRRGVLGTAIAAHAAGAPFIRLDDAVFDVPFLATQAGQTVYAKFQSFNLWGQGVTPLANCNAYAFEPISLGPTGPGSSAWSAVTGQIGSGQQLPAILITGASDNPSAQDMEFYVRPTGATAWNPVLKASNNTTNATYTIGGVAPNTYYDVGVAYQVNGVIGAVTAIATSLLTGAIATGIGAGTVIIDTMVSGSFSVLCPAGSYAHADVEIWGPDGENFYKYFDGVENLEQYGGAGGYSIYAGHAATPGSTTFAGSIGAFPGGTTTCTTLSMTANQGGSAPNKTTPGTGGTASGGTTNTTGATGGGVQNGGRLRITARA